MIVFSSTVSFQSGFLAVNMRLRSVINSSLPRIFVISISTNSVFAAEAEAFPVTGAVLKEEFGASGDFFLVF